MAINNVQVESTQTTVVFSSNGESAITTVFFCNTSDTLDATLDVHLVPAAQAVSSATLILKSLSLPAKETFVLDAEKLILSSNDSMYAISSQDKIITATVSSVSTQ